MMMSRKPLSKKLRFEVLKRDTFTCQYCGAKAPDVILNVDHMHPVAKDGSNDLINLITSCQDCNFGKGARTLDDQSLVQKQRDQLQELAKKKEQIEMMIQWRKSLIDADETTLAQVIEFFCEYTGPMLSLTPQRQALLAKLVKNHRLDLILQAIETAVDQYFPDDEPIMFERLPGIIRSMEKSETDPFHDDAVLIANVVRKQMNMYNCTWQQLYHLAHTALEQEVSTRDTMIHMAYNLWSAEEWKRHIQQILDASTSRGRKRAKAG
jgi:hypothetical protein